ncbi:LacI family DNA-binding transcriptional regulator [Bifidobacterium fermentum]|uniref:LacI family DNA-binding transcriptional regulator n=1 Tax=Bifidobacterium fermentum TaxID=3059035 RepID=A0AB39UJ68_9BIFI
MLLKDLAEMAGVSLSTVSRALHGDARISEATRKRIQEIADREHFVLSKSASALASRKSFRITALFVDHFNTWFTSTSLEGLYSVISQSDYDLFPLALHTPEEFDTFFRLLSRNNNTDGIIISSIHLSDSHTEQLAASHIPVVGLDSYGTQGYDAAVVLNNDESMLMAARRIKLLGHTAIGFVHYPQPGLFHDYSYSERIPQFERICRAQGYPERSFHHFASSNGKADREGVESILRQWTATTPRPSVLFVETDDFAITLMSALREQGLRIPEDVSVVGFDDNPVSKLIGLATFRQNALGNARYAAQTMLSLLKADQPEGSLPERADLAGVKAAESDAQKPMFSRDFTSFIARRTLGPAPKNAARH